MKILVVRFSSIGDIVLISPVLRCLQEQLPVAEIHVATKKRFAGLLKPNPHVHCVHELDDSFADFAAKVRREKFDVVVDLHRNIRTLRLKLMLPGVKWLSFNKANLQKWLLVRGWSHKSVKHVVERYMDAVAPLGVQYDGRGLDYFTENAELPAGLPQKYVAYAIGGTWQTKRMPLPKMKELIAASEQNWVLLGDGRDAEDGRVLQSEFPDKVVDLCGKLSLAESAMVLKGAHAVVSHDTGLMHIAAAYGKKMISVWGNTVPEFGMYPWLADSVSPANMVISEVTGLDCRPCSKIGFEKCPKGHFRCMNEQQTKRISAALETRSLQ